MPFSQQTSRPYTRENIELITPGQMGCYGILNHTGVVIYVGEGDIRDRMLAHVRRDNPCITREGPTFWVSEVTPNADARERALILEFDPVCNRRVG